MELDFALLADEVSVGADGKLTIVGAGVDLLVAPTVPTIHARIVLILRAFVSIEEAREPHRVAVRVVGPGGNQVGSTYSDAQPVPEAVLALGESLSHIGMGTVQDMRNLRLPSYGRYEFAISWDGEPVRSVDLLVLESPPRSPD